MARASRVTESIESSLEFCICGALQGFYSDPPYWPCAACKKPTRAWMNECDTCNKLFKGGIPFSKWAFTCPDCEAKL